MSRFALRAVRVGLPANAGGPWGFA
ncbi:hypothetical protein PT2222_270098 [Paraburkholderia tropica]